LSDKETRLVVAPAWFGNGGTPADLANSESALRMGPYHARPDHLLVSIVVHPPDDAAHILIPPNLVNAPSVRKLRTLATYARQQGRIADEMAVEDELKAMGAIARTLDSLPEQVRARVLGWLSDRNGGRLIRGAPLSALLSPEDSLRIAKDRVLS
jgi:hypothetical protein